MSDYFIKRDPSFAPTGPFSLDEIERMIQMEQVDPAALVREGETGEWVACADCEVTRGLFTVHREPSAGSAAPYVGPTCISRAAASFVLAVLSLACGLSLLIVDYLLGSAIRRALRYGEYSDYRMAVGVLAILLCMMPAVLAIVLSWSTRTEMKRNRNTAGRGLATAGLVIGETVLLTTIGYLVYGGWGLVIGVVIAVPAGIMLTRLPRDRGKPSPASPTAAPPDVSVPTGGSGS